MMVFAFRVLAMRPTRSVSTHSGLRPIQSYLVRQLWRFNSPLEEPQEFPPSWLTRSMPPSWPGWFL